MVTGRAAFAMVTRAEVEEIVASAALRGELEALLRDLERSYLGLEGLVLFVFDDEIVVGFAELLVEGEQLRWYGPHVAPRSDGFPIRA
jgi:hypothetical protein